MFVVVNFLLRYTLRFWAHRERERDRVRESIGGLKSFKYSIQEIVYCQQKAGVDKRKKEY